MEPGLNASPPPALEKLGWHGPQVMDFGDDARIRNWPDAEEHRLMDDYMKSVRAARDRMAAVK